MWGFCRIKPRANFLCKWIHLLCLVLFIRNHLPDTRSNLIHSFTEHMMLSFARHVFNVSRSLSLPKLNVLMMRCTWKIHIWWNDLKYAKSTKNHLTHFQAKLFQFIFLFEKNRHFSQAIQLMILFCLALISAFSTFCLMPYVECFIFSSY